MSRLKTRPDKRRAELTRDHRTDMEAPHAFRKNWPRKKARVNRNRRRVADAAVRAVLGGAEPDGLVVPRRLRGEHLRKMGVAPLGEVVARKNQRTRTDFLPRYIVPRGNPSDHAEMFRGFLTALLQGRSPVAVERARYLVWLLDAELPNNHRVLYKQTWLRRFFATNTRWEVRVRNWCRRVQERAS